MKQKIVGNLTADHDLAFRVCSHLQPIANHLWDSGLRWNPSHPLYTDKGGAHSLLVTGVINYFEIEELFELPDFIEVNQKYHCIICRRCWCDITEKGHELD